MDIGLRIIYGWQRAVPQCLLMSVDTAPRSALLEASPCLSGTEVQPRASRSRAVVSPAFVQSAQ